MKYIRLFELHEDSKWYKKVTHLIEPKADNWYIVPSYVIQTDERGTDIELVPGDILHIISREQTSTGMYLCLMFEDNSYTLAERDVLAWFDSDVNDNASTDKWEEKYIMTDERERREKLVFGRSKSGVEHFGRLTKEQAEILLHEQRGKINTKKYGI